MAKLRKTLGGIDWPVCEALMRQIETQSTVTLSRWAVDHAAREYLPLCGEAPALTAAVEGCRKHLTGQLSLKELKPLLREASAAARDTEGAVKQAAARATATACDPDPHQRPGLSVLRSSGSGIQQGRHRGRLPVGRPCPGRAGTGSGRTACRFGAG